MTNPRLFPISSKAKSSKRSSAQAQNNYSQTATTQNKASNFSSAKNKNNYKEVQREFLEKKRDIMRVGFDKKSVKPTNNKNKKVAKKTLRKRRKSSFSWSRFFFLHSLRLSVIILGSCAIAATAWVQIQETINTGVNSNNKQSQDVKQKGSALSKNKSKQSPPELTGLGNKFTILGEKYPNLKPGAFFIDLDNQAYVNWGGSKVYSAASTIKIPVLVAFFQAVDAGKIALDQQLTMTKELIAGGSGNMQYQKPGTKFTALTTAKKMIIISDNTATNMLIELLGGKETLNQIFQSWGLNNTVINNPLPDLTGTNTTTPAELAQLLVKVEKGELISSRSRDRLLEIMRQTKTRTLLPQGLESGATIAHKTGDIGKVLGDAGIIDMPNGKRYIGAVLVERPHNDPQAKRLIQEISKTAYQHFKWYQPRQSFTQD